MRILALILIFNIFCNKIDCFSKDKNEGNNRKTVTVVKIKDSDNEFTKQYDPDTDRYYAIPRNKKISNSRAVINQKSSMNQINPHFILMSDYRSKRDDVGVDIVDVKTFVGKKIQKDYSDDKKLIDLNKDKKVFLKEESVPDISNIKVTKAEVVAKKTNNAVEKPTVTVAAKKPALVKAGNTKFMAFGFGYGINSNLTMKGTEQARSIAGNDPVIDNYKVNTSNLGSNNFILSYGTPVVSKSLKNFNHEYHFYYGSLYNSGNIHGTWIYNGANSSLSIQDLSTKLIGVGYGINYTLRTPSRFDFFLGPGFSGYYASSKNNFLNSGILLAYYFKIGFDFNLTSKVKIATQYRIEVISGDLGNANQVVDPTATLSSTRPLQQNDSSINLTRHMIEVLFKFY